MGLGDLGNKAKDAMNSDKGEQATDKGLDQAAQKASDASGGKFDDQINKGSDAADGKLGNE
ncbi:antitoxin [Brevibacterium luteolum]|uniref:antitoxin n=1 Tax=Brevibacterium luteolum TaxID=199591 RepID=UPI00387A74F2